MDPGTLAKATEPFFTTKGLGKGTGLGLSMVHGLAVQSGGAMKISSEPGRGTRVDLWLPQAAGAELPPNVKGDRTELRRDVPKTSPRRILVVDDDPLVRIGTVAMLEELGHVAVEAESGNQALTLVDNGPAFDIVITDHAMPGMTGLELAAALRARCLDLPVILATGYAELPTSSLEHFTLPRLSKPYSQADLSVSIAEVAGPGLMQIEKVNST
jgi:CheY-like chemotaxis protein